ncbi:histidine phosphatase family protein [Gordonia sp. VNQ95]|jgi:probable phosphoglycerate mutase|uniref:histidine phosphatase family protein n=1 Tax=Gordonia TaxID=2053 RepID=UPI0032B32892
MAAPTRLVLVRHGQTPLSVERRYSGRGNPALTGLGVAQAAGAAERIALESEVAAVISSPLERTRATAQAIVDRVGGEVIVDEGFVENDFGTWEGLTFSEAKARDPEIHARWLGDSSVPAPGGESFTQTAERVIAAKERLLGQFPGQTVVVVSHVTPIKSLLRHALDVGPQLLFRLHLDLASVSVTEFFPDGGAVVRSVNETAHLR